MASAASAALTPTPAPSALSATSRSLPLPAIRPRSPLQPRVSLTESLRHHRHRRPLCLLSAGVSALLVSAGALVPSSSRRGLLLSLPPLSLSLLPGIPVSHSLAASPAVSPAAGSADLSSSIPSSGLRTASAAMANVSIGKPAMPTITIPARQEHKATVVFMHGLGDTGDGWADVPNTLNLPNVKWVFPSAPIKPVSVNGGFPMPSWFDIFGLSADAREDEQGIDRAAQYIASLLAKEKDAAPAGTKILVGGFSQGGAISLYLTARKFTGSFLDGTDASGVPLDGTICLSGWLPVAKGIKEAGLNSADAAASYPLLECHGEADSVVQFSFGKGSSEALKALGFSSLQFKAYRGLAHSACPEEFQDIKSWMTNLISTPPQ